MNKNLITISLVILLITGCQTNKTGSQNTASETKSALKTYESSKYGFTFQYPKKWNVFDETNSELAGIVISPEKEKTLLSKMGIAGINIIGISPKKVQPNEENEALRALADSWIKITKNVNKKVNIELSESKIVIGGKKIIKLDIKNGKMIAPDDLDFGETNYILGNGAMYFFIHNGQRFKMAYMYPIQDERKYLDTLNQIVSSLKFK